MSTKVIEQELAALKQRLDVLEAKSKIRSAWRTIVGTSPGDDLDREAARLGEAWRARENKRK